MEKPETIGYKIRTLRENQEMPLRKLAALLDIDQSTLSKIERDERKPNSQMLEDVARIFKTKKEELVLAYLSDMVCTEIKKENQYNEILQLAEQKIKFERSKTGKTKV